MSSKDSGEGCGGDGDGNDESRADVKLARSRSRNSERDNVHQLTAVARIGDPVHWDGRQIPDSIMFLRDRDKERARIAARIRRARSTAGRRRDAAESKVLSERQASARRARSYRRYVEQKIAQLHASKAEGRARSAERLRRLRVDNSHMRRAAAFWKSVALVLTSLTFLAFCGLGALLAGWLP